MKLVDETKSELCSMGEDSFVYDSHGNVMDNDKASQDFTKIWDIISDAFRYSNESCADISHGESLKDYFQKRLAVESAGVEYCAKVLELAEVWGSFIGDPFEMQSLKWFWFEECLDGDNLFLANTHKAILDHVARAALEKSSMHLSTIVHRISTPAELTEGSKVLVQTSNGDFEFDKVIVTIPLGCLKSRSIDFIPELPYTMTQAIASASYSRLEKAFITFPAAFWDAPTAAATDGAESPSSSGSPFPCFTNFLRPQYVAEEQQSWTLEVVAMSSPAVFGSHAQPTLLFHLWGEAATQMTSAIEDLAPTDQEYYSTITRLFEPFFSRLPNYSKTDANCRPTAVLATQWQNDDFAGRGSYTNFKVPKADGDRWTGDGGMPIDEGVRTMREGLPERGVWFAGEHTAPFVALGTSTGAYWSGELVADKVIRCLENYAPMK
ncbi:hypothetical protein MMC25_003516 [Agyrium rufum]|nr:hypothetical protein [Agyrium rufum]